MDNHQILSRYQRAITTQKRRIWVRSIMTCSLIVLALLRLLEFPGFIHGDLLLYSLMFIYFAYSYAIGRRIGAAKDFRAITEHYLRQDAELAKHIIQ